MTKQGGQSRATIFRNEPSSSPRSCGTSTTETMKEREKAGHSGSATRSREANRGNANKDEVVFQKMRHLVYDHVARTVAIERTSLSSPPTVDSLAGDFKKLMDELRPETRKALGQAFGPIAAGQQSPVPENTPAAKGQLDALDRYYSDEILEKLEWNCFPGFGAGPHRSGDRT